MTTADGYYYPGEFDGYSFNWSGKRYCLYMNKVPYAAQTYSNTDGRVIFVPWLRLDFKGRKYTGAMGIPRELGLIKIDNEYRITLKPVQEFKDEFKYYEYTSIEKIIIDEHNLVPFIFFLPEGINYLMPKIIDSISNGIRNDDIPVNIEEFIINIPTAENITHALNLLKKDELIILKKYLEKILFGDSSNLIQQIGEHYLFRSIDYLEKLINNS